MSRTTRARRTRRRARKAREADEPTSAPEAEAPTDWERVAARFRCLQGRAVKLGFILIGPPVPARTPKELAESTAVALAGLLKDEPEN